MASATTATKTIQAVNPAVPLTEFIIMQDVVDESISSRRFVVALLAGFAGFALVLACLGIYGVISYSVSRRRREMGIRMALGAAPGELQRSILRGTMRLAAIGVILGLVGAAALARALASMLYGVAPSDPVTYAATAVVLFAVALAAAYIPARRAARTQLVTTLLASS